MLNQPTLSQQRSGLDTAIKVLTIFKLLFQTGFYGLLLGGTLWFLIKNPLPQMLENIQAQMVQSFLGK